MGFWITRLARSMEQDFERRLQATGMTRGAFAVLSAIHYDKKATPAELAGFLGVDGAAVTRHLDRIEKLRLIQRKPSATDRRSVDIELTQEGIQAVKRGRADSKATNKTFTQGLSPAEIKALRATIHAMLDNAGDTIADV